MKIGFWPLARATLIAFAESVGLAMKKLSIGIDVPAAGPLAQVVPWESRRSAGTKTLQWLYGSTYKNGFSLVNASSPGISGTSQMVA